VGVEEVKRENIHCSIYNVQQQQKKNAAAQGAGAAAVILHTEVSSGCRDLFSWQTCTIEM